MTCKRVSTAHMGPCSNSWASVIFKSWRGLELCSVGPLQKPCSLGVGLGRHSWRNARMVCMNN